MKRGDRWRPPYDFAAALPTFVDAWPPEWHDLAPAGEIVPLDAAEANALGGQIAGFRHWFEPAPARVLADLAYRLDAAVARQGRSSFVRLTSRSPKDSLAALRRGMRVRDGAQALALFVEGSERCAADLRMALEGDHDAGIVVRRWIDFPWWAEYRCFMVGREWVGGSQAGRAGEAALPAVADHAQAVLGALDVAMRRIVAASPLADAAFDLVVRPSGDDPPEPAPAILLDVNPLLHVTDLALFASAADFDRTFRFRGREDRAHVAVPLPTPGA